MKGKITNTTELVECIVKTNPVLRNCNLDISKLIVYTAATNNRVQTLTDYVDVAKDVNVVLDKLSNHGAFSWIMLDLVKYARMLNRKIDFNWDLSTITSKRIEWEREIEAIREEWLPLYSF